MKKKGATQIDWVISLGVFILFLALFFIIIKPNVLSDVRPDALTSDIREGFVKSTEWEVIKTPLFVESAATDFFIVDSDTVDTIIKVVNIDDVTTIVYTTSNEGLEDSLNDSVDIGFPILIKGLNLNKMNNLSSEDPDNLKILWNIPEDIDFSIEVRNSTNITFFINSSVPQDSDNVFVDNFNDFILTDEAELEHVEVFLRAW